MRASLLLGFAAINPAAAAGEVFHRGSEFEGEWKEEVLPMYIHEKGYLVNTTRYTAPPVFLETGGAFFSENRDERVPFPAGDYFVIRTDFRLIDGTTVDLPDGQQRQIPLNEVYLHHWLIGTTLVNFPLLPCGSLFLGAGAEMRHTPTIPPLGYGTERKNAQPYCGANLHFIRTEDLATNWTGMNDPSKFADPKGAATKNCAECGYAPGRASGCNPTEKSDGSFDCCMTGSRCPVNHPQDKSKKSYVLQYDVQWTRDMTAVKPIGGGCLDTSAGAIEWNVAPNLKGIRHQTCTDTICNSSANYVVGAIDSPGLEPGTMLWSYLHQHNGAINGTMYVNGKWACTSVPEYGTDPSNPAGNEKGYLIGFSACIGQGPPWNKNNAIKLFKGDVVRIDGLYDVDVKSTRSSPMPGGKHGGVMGLYFFMSTYNSNMQRYTCQDNACTPVDAPGDDTFDGHESCNYHCGPRDRFHCDSVSSKCIKSSEGHSTIEKCSDAC